MLLFSLKKLYAARLHKSVNVFIYNKNAIAGVFVTFFRVQIQAFPQVALPTASFRLP